jgi:phenylacetate-CoA ligase
MTTSPTTTAADPRALAGELLGRTAWSADRLAAHQRRRLRALIGHAVAASPYYRRVLGPDAVDAPLRQLPTLPKATLMDNFDEILTVPGLDRAALEAHLAGPGAAEPFASHLVLSTSGATGLRGIFVYSQADFVPWVAAFIRTMAVFGATPTTRVGGVGAPGAMHISKHLLAALAAGRAAPTRPTSAVTPLPELVATFNAYQPEALAGYPSVQALLAEEQLAGRLRIAPRIVACAGEVVTDDMRARTRAAWGIDPQVMYASTEVAILASSCPAQAGLQIWEDLLVLEVVDEHDRPVPPGVPGHKVLVTNLVNRTQPLIRYELSDLVTLAGGPNPTGWPFRRIAAVEGRSDDILHLPASGGGTVAVHPLHLRAPFAAFPDVLQYQVVHDQRGLSVWVVLRPSASARTPDQVRAALHDRLLSAGALPPPITVTPVTTIEREGGQAAKFKIVKSQPGQPG